MILKIKSIYSNMDRIGIRRYAFFHLDHCYDFFSGVWSTAACRLKCLIMGIEIGKRLKVYGPTIFRQGLGRICIGHDCSFISNSRRATGSSVYQPVRIRVFMAGASVTIGNHSGMTGGSITCRSGKIAIGNHVMIGPNCIFMNSDFHPLWPPEARLNYPGTELDTDIIIGDNVWIGAHSMIMRGAEIGENSIVCSGSIVSSKVPPNCMVSGNPARIIKKFAETPSPDIRS